MDRGLCGSHADLRNAMKHPTLRGFDPVRLAAARTAAGMTVGDLARLAGVGPSAVYNWESGYRTPQPDSLARVAKALGAGIDEFVTIPAEQRTLVDLRVLVGLTQPQLAARMEISTQALGLIERGERPLDDARSERLAQHLDVSADIVRSAYERVRTRPPGTLA
jgi:transcriptional regulator with XRE-family HTH domain